MEFGKKFSVVGFDKVAEVIKNSQRDINIAFVNELKDFGCNVEVYDPRANDAEVEHEYGVDLLREPPKHAYGAVILAVAHDEFKGTNPRDWTLPGGVVYAVKALYPQNLVDGRL